MKIRVVSMGSRMWVSCTRCFVTCSSVAVDYLGRFLRTFERRPAKSEAKIVAKVLVGSKGLWNTQLTVVLFSRFVAYTRGLCKNYWFSFGFS